MRPARIAAVVAGAFGALVALALAAAGGTLVWAHVTQRDGSGFYTTPATQLATTGYALTGRADFGAGATEQDWVPSHVLGTVRIRATAVGGQPVFVGIGPQVDVDRYLAGVARTEVTSISYGPFETLTRTVPGIRAPALPAQESFWVASASGPATQTLTWASRGGQWEAVAMNADASPGVAVVLNLGARTGLLLPLGIGLLCFGLLLMAGFTLLMLFGLRAPAEERGPVPAAKPGPVPAAAVQPGTAAYPARLDGHLDPGVSRWLWLFKWLLVIPHVFCLVFLWLAVVVLTFAAGFAILFTGRYPRSVFDFNVGVMRWTWRVGYYSLNAFGTDRYPPFSLDHDPSYPADFDVDYPERLSRGLVLVKWWLLAIPHYMVVAIFAGGIGLGWNGAGRAASGGGLIALLALIAAVVLAFSGRYPESIFDFVMAMNRWCYRVLAYVTLMRDEYPPFRLDMGGADPGSVPVLPPPGPPTPTTTEREMVGSGIGAGAGADQSRD